MRTLITLCAVALLAGCAGSPVDDPIAEAPQFAAETPSNLSLKMLPPAKQKVAVAVYRFRDQTGQHKPNDSIAEYSTAVTQGATSILVQALHDTAKGGWFQVIERESLTSLLQERQIIQSLGNPIQPGATAQPAMLPPLLHAGVLLEGGIISYETNLLTGGVGARFLGIGGDVKYRRDMVSIYLRAVSVKTGEVLKTVNTSKTIYSAAVSAGIFKFIAPKSLLEVEAGVTTNEPPQLAVRQAMEKAVYGLIMEGALAGYWTFADEADGRVALEAYLAERGDGQTLPEPELPSVVING